MSPLLWLTAALAAFIFIVASATTNALFLASLGRNETEAALYVAISVAADLAKIVLPVVLTSAIVVRGWLMAALSAVMLLAVTALSVSSGAGFAAMTRGSLADGRTARAAQMSALQDDHVVLKSRLARLAGVREPFEIAAALEAAHNDRLWRSSKGCANATTEASQTFCVGVRQLKVEAAGASERERLASQERAIRGRIEALRQQSPSGIDPQAQALAQLLGVDWQRLRAGLGLGLALVMELGAIVLVLVLASPVLRASGVVISGDHEKKQPALPVEQITVSPQVDRSFWYRQRGRALERNSGGRDEQAAL